MNSSLYVCFLAYCMNIDSFFFSCKLELNLDLVTVVHYVNLSKFTLDDVVH